MTENDFIRTLRAEYLQEARFLLEMCEESLLGLEADEGRACELNNLFRAIHTVKGSGAAVGFEDLVKFAHVFEDCLALLRDAPERLTTEMTSLFLRAVDALKQRILAHTHGTPGVWDVTGLRTELEAAKAGLSGETAAPTMAFGFFDEKEAAPSPNVVAAVVAAVANAPSHTAAPVAQSIKIDANRVDQVLDSVGELVVAKSQLLNHIAPYPSDLALQAVCALLDTIIKDLQDKALSMRLTPLKPLFLKLQRSVRDLSLKVGKSVKFVMAGEDVEIDRTMVEQLADPLMHMVRNSLDHGIENSDSRRIAGKPEAGTVTIGARQMGGRVVIEIKDDGAGIRRDRVIAKAIEQGIVDEVKAKGLSDQEAFALIFAPGFSTAAVVTDVSGRGVGMDVVKTNVERLKGTIEISSEVGLGTTFTISLPLTASIADGIMIGIHGRPFVVPMEAVRDLVALTDKEESKLGFVRVRGAVLPYVDLRKQLATLLEPVVDESERPMIVVVEHAGRKVALGVDQVHGQMQVVLKPLSGFFKGVAGLAGAAVLGDGRVALVIEVSQLLTKGAAA